MFRPTLSLFGDNELLPDVVGEAKFLNETEHAELLNWCIHSIDWKDVSVNYGGRSISVPRRLAWHGPVLYTYSGITHRADPLPAVLIELARKIEKWLKEHHNCDATFNSVLLNCYRDGNDSIGMHSDDERQLGAEPVIASISLGASRNFVFQHKETKTRLVEPLAGGSLLVMKGKTQEYWRHGVPKEKDAGLRINLTFRNTLRS